MVIVGDGLPNGKVDMFALTVIFPFTAFAAEFAGLTAFAFVGFVFVFFGGVGFFVGVSSATAPEKATAPILERPLLLKNKNKAPSTKIKTTINLAVFFMIRTIKNPFLCEVNILSTCVEAYRLLCKKMVT